MPLFDMNFFDTLKSVSGRFVETFGTPFRYDGVDFTFSGNFNEDEAAFQMIDGGNMEEREATLVVEFSEFAKVSPVVVPANGKRISRDRKQYKIIRVSKSTTSYSLRLQGVNQK